MHDPTALGVPRPGDVIAGKYKVERVIGIGGMGVVVSALHMTLGQHFAIKFLLPSAIQAPSAIEGRASAPSDAVTRFEREARAAAGLQSEHVVRTVDVGTLEDGAPYMVMELLQGEDLGGRVRARGPLPYEEAIDYVLQACEAIAEAHARGIVHRDLKPANLFLTRRADGSALVKVLDFGIAKATQGLDPITDRDLTSTATLIGSPFYMSPEQIRTPKGVDARTDVWALGVILYELLSGKTPFNGENFGSLCAAIVADAPPKLRTLKRDLPEGLEAAVMRCLEKDTARRTRDVAVLAKELAPFAPSQSKISIARIVSMIGADPWATISTAHVADAQAVSSMAETLPASSEKSPASEKVATGTSWSGTGATKRPKRVYFAAFGFAVLTAVGGTVLFARGRGDHGSTTGPATAIVSATIDAMPSIAPTSPSASAVISPAPLVAPPSDRAEGSAASPLANAPALALPKPRPKRPSPASSSSTSAPKGPPSASPLDDRK